MHYDATITAKGQVTVPVRLRELLNLKDGDRVEFYVDHDGRVMLRPRNRSTKGFLDALPPHQADPSVSSDDEAVAKAAKERDKRSRRHKAK